MWLDESSLSAWLVPFPTLDRLQAGEGKECELDSRDVTDGGSKPRTSKKSTEISADMLVAEPRWRFHSCAFIRVRVHAYVSVTSRLRLRYISNVGTYMQQVTLRPESKVEIRHHKWTSEQGVAPSRGEDVVAETLRKPRWAHVIYSITGLEWTNLVVIRGWLVNQMRK